MKFNASVKFKLVSHFNNMARSKLQNVARRAIQPGLMLLGIILNCNARTRHVAFRAEMVPHGSAKIFVVYKIFGPGGSVRFAFETVPVQGLGQMLVESRPRYLSPTPECLSGLP